MEMRLLPPQHCTIVLRYLFQATVFITATEGNPFTRTTVEDMGLYYESTGEPPCELTVSTMTSCYFTSIQCTATCGSDAACMYAASVRNQCYLCATPHGNAAILDETGNGLDLETIVFAKVSPVEADTYSSYDTYDCDFTLDANGGGGVPFSDATRAEGRTLTGFHFCISGSDAVNGYTAYYDHVAQESRACSSASVEVAFQDGEVVTGIDIYTNGIQRGITLHTTLGTHGHYGTTNGIFETVRGYNLEYIFGRVGGALDALEFHFTRC